MCWGLSLSAGHSHCPAAVWVSLKGISHAEGSLHTPTGFGNFPGQRGHMCRPHVQTAIHADLWLRICMMQKSLCSSLTLLTHTKSRRMYLLLNPHLLRVKEERMIYTGCFILIQVLCFNFSSLFLPLNLIYQPGNNVTNLNITIPKLWSLPPNPSFLNFFKLKILADTSFWCTHLNIVIKMHYFLETVKEEL